MDVRRAVLIHAWGMDLHPTVQLSTSAKLDRTYPSGVHVGEHSFLAFESRILTHDRTRGLYLDTYVGRNCFIGGRALIMPGVTVGDDCVVAAGAIVVKDVPPRSIVAGNPAKVVRRDIEVTAYGRFVDADETEQALIDAGQLD